LGRIGVTNPYRIEGPALISFSGGRTSGYMLWHILDAYDGKLPDDVYVPFANTGKERPETLRFVHECESRWGVRVRWLEYRPDDTRFEEVNFDSASRAGEPFEALIRKYKRVPNAFTRFCTGKLKIRVMRAFMLAQGHHDWISAIGLRADEMRRVFKAIERNQGAKECGTEVMPLVTAKVRHADVMAFWDRQPFDLGLAPGEGNCDNCMVKSIARLKQSIRDRPGSAVWWKDMEALTGAEFIQGRSFASLIREVETQPLLPLDEDFEAEHDAECGLWCAGEAA
jgi:3'-phosphoadenosine 5'-phosphosulfate sulfotransferase (PAPS reductase)/FAD synthetase